MSASGRVTHIVLFRWREDATAREIDEVVARFRALAGTERDGAPYILSITDGPQRSPEGVGRGFDHGFVVEFASMSDRDYYVGRPFIADDEPFDTVHDAFKEFVGPVLADVLVFDFQSRAETAGGM